MPKAEQQIQAIKEKVRAYHLVLPFLHMNLRMIIDMSKMVVMLLSVFPPKGGLYKTCSLRTIVTGKQIDFKKTCRIPLGAYEN